MTLAERCLGPSAVPLAALLRGGAAVGRRTGNRLDPYVDQILNTCYLGIQNARSPRHLAAAVVATVRASLTETGRLTAVATSALTSASDLEATASFTSSPSADVTSGSAFGWRVVVTTTSRPFGGHTVRAGTTLLRPPTGGTARADECRATGPTPAPQSAASGKPPTPHLAPQVHCSPPESRRVLTTCPSTAT